MAAMRVGIVHGMSYIEYPGGTQSDEWQEGWRQDVAAALAEFGVEPDCRFFLYDDVFRRDPANPQEYAEAVAKLLFDLGKYSLLDLFRRRALMPPVIEGTAGMLAKWVSEPAVRQELRQKFVDWVTAEDVQVVIAHSMGSLISYDAFSELANRPALKGRVYVTVGSQIGFPAVRGVFGGRVTSLKEARAWFHLFNEKDGVFTATVAGLGSGLSAGFDFPSDNFVQLDTTFGSWPFGGHDARGYLLHEEARKYMWPWVSSILPGTRAMEPGSKNPPVMPMPKKPVSAALRRPKHRALLVGINEYPDPKMRLQGCVNDVFTMSALLQDTGIDPEDIRVVLDDRATKEGIVDRLQWLLENVEDGYQRVFYYSGHGAQLPGYGAKGEVDHIDECLVPHDFDWSLERAVTDDDMVGLYANLPYDARLIIALDCCHSGGMTRGDAPLIRGLEAPDDIRHRMLRWNGKEEVWVPRDMPPVLKKADDWGRRTALMVGSSHSSRRIARGLVTRQGATKKEISTIQERKGHKGPYLPTILMACGEDQYSFEYRHGVESHGAFTYALNQTLRRHWKSGPTKNETANILALVRDVRDKLKRLGYDQTPEVLGPTEVLRTELPYMPWG